MCEWNYDLNGNIRRFSHDFGTDTLRAVVRGNETLHNMLGSVTSLAVGNRSFAYDSRGNRTAQIDSLNDRTVQMHYSPRNELERYEVIDDADTDTLKMVQVHDLQGRKVASFEQTSTGTFELQRRYVYEGNYIIADYSNEEDWSWYPQLGGQPVGRIQANITANQLIGEWWLRDHLGTVQLSLNDSGQTGQPETSDKIYLRDLQVYREMENFGGMK